MASSIESIRNISTNLGINEDVLIREGTVAYIKSRIKAHMRDRLEIMHRYRISSLDEFEEKVRDGDIPEHPGWEDLIVLENIEASINKLETELLHVKDLLVA